MTALIGVGEAVASCFECALHAGQHCRGDLACVEMAGKSKQGLKAFDLVSAFGDLFLRREVSAKRSQIACVKTDASWRLEHGFLDLSFPFDRRFGRDGDDLQRVIKAQNLHAEGLWRGFAAKEGAQRGAGRADPQVLWAELSRRGLPRDFIHLAREAVAPATPVFRRQGRKEISKE